MNVSIEDKKAEAVVRMKLLGIFPETIRQFEKEGYIGISEPPLGAFYWADDEDLKHIREFERKQRDGIRCHSQLYEHWQNGFLPVC